MEWNEIKVGMKITVAGCELYLEETGKGRRILDHLGCAFEVSQLSLDAPGQGMTAIPTRNQILIRCKLHQRVVAVCIKDDLIITKSDSRVYWYQGASKSGCAQLSSMSKWDTITTNNTYTPVRINQGDIMAGLTVSLRAGSTRVKGGHNAIIEATTPDKRDDEQPIIWQGTTLHVDSDVEDSDVEPKKTGATLAQEEAVARIQEMFTQAVDSILLDGPAL